MPRLALSLLGLALVASALAAPLATVTLHVFSGTEDPVFELDDSTWANLQDALAAAPSDSGRPATRLGYSGFTVVSSSWDA